MYHALLISLVRVFVGVGVAGYPAESRELPHANTRLDGDDVRVQQPRESSAPVDYMIMVTGGELLSGVYADGHTHFLTRTLRPLGLRCVGSISVDDQRGDIIEALRFATAKANLVIVTGGLGPTNSDITRDTLSDFTGIPLREQPDVLSQLRRRFGVSRGQLRPNLRRQTRVPTRGTYLPNAQGSAVGLVFEAGDATIVALPGPPRELQPMVHRELVPYLSRRFGTHLPGCSLMLRFVGIGQSQISQTLKERVTLPPDVATSSQFDGSRVDYTFALPGDTPQDRAKLDQLKQKILQHLGEYVYSDDETTLEQQVVKRLAASGTTLALAEVGSGGALAAGLSTTRDAHRALIGAYVAPTEERLRKLLQVPDATWENRRPVVATTEILAGAVARLTGSDWVIVVGEPQVQNDRRMVEVAVKPPGNHLERQPMTLRGTGQPAHARLTTQLLDQLRRRLK